MTTLFEYEGQQFNVPSNISRFDNGQSKGWRVRASSNMLFCDDAYGGIQRAFNAAKNAAYKNSGSATGAKLITRESIVEGKARKLVFAAIEHPAKMGMILRYVGLEDNINPAKARAKLAEVRRMRNLIIAQYQN